MPTTDKDNDPQPLSCPSFGQTCVGPGQASNLDSVLPTQAYEFLGIILQLFLADSEPGLHGAEGSPKPLRSSSFGAHPSRKLFETKTMGLGMAEPRTLFTSCRSITTNSETPGRRWLAVYTRSGHESAVAKQFQQKGLEALLPKYCRLSRWSDRIRRIDTPLFPSFVFVRVGEGERSRVLQTAGVVSVVCCAGTPVTLSEPEIQRLRRCATDPYAIEPHPYLRVGQRVRVKHGPFQNWEGVLVQKKNSTRLVITVEQILKSVSIDLHGADVEPLG